MYGRVAFFVVGTLLSAQARGGDTAVHFDDLAPGFWTGNEYSDLGVTFSTAGHFLIANDSSFDTVPIFVAGSVDGTRGDAPITARFWQATGDPGMTDTVRFNVIDFGGVEAWSARAYGLDGTLLEAVSGTGGGFGDPYLVEFHRNTPDIFAVTFLPSVEYEGIDTLVFGTVVPAPPSIILMSGLVASLCAKQNRRTDGRVRTDGNPRRVANPRPIALRDDAVRR